LELTTLKNAESRQSNIASLVAGVLVATIGTSGCGGNKTTSTTTATTTTTSTATPATTTGATTASTNTSSPGTDKDTTSSTAAGAEKAPAKTGADNTPVTATSTVEHPVLEPGKEGDKKVAAGSLPQIAAAQKKINLNRMQDTITICTVNGVPITIGDYRRQFHLQQEQIRSQLSVNSDLQQELIADAKRNKLDLTADEKKRLVETARKAQKATGGVLQKYLDQQHMTMDQFDKQVLAIGLAVKDASKNIEKRLLSELVDRELFCSAARSNGMGPSAFNKYTELKNTPQFKFMEKSNMMSPDDLKDEVIKAQLMQMMMEKIQEKATPTDQQISEFYEKNKDKFKHGDRVRFGQIMIACPETDGPAGASIRTQLKKEKPNITPAELDAEAKVRHQQLYNKAQEILAKAVKGDDFAQLANQYTDDIPSRAAKLGGDMGFQDKDRLVPSFAKKILPLKTGQVCPELIESPLGFHIVKVTDRQSAGTLPLAEVKDGLKHLMAQSNQGIAIGNWIKDQRKNAQITLSPEFQQLVSAGAKTDAPD